MASSDVNVTETESLENGKDETDKLSNVEQETSLLKKEESDTTTEAPAAAPTVFVPKYKYSEGLYFLFN